MDSGEQLPHHPTLHIGQAEIASLESMHKTLVIHPEAVKNRGVQIMHMDLVPGREIAVLISLPMGHPRLDPAPSHPDAESMGMMVSAVVPASALGHRGSTKLPPPDHQGFIEQAPLLEINQQRGRPLVHRGTLAAMIFSIVAC